MRACGHVPKWELSDTIDLRIATFAAVGRYPRTPSQLHERIREEVGLAVLCHRRLQRSFRWLADRGYVVRRSGGWIRAPRSDDRAVELSVEAARCHPGVTHRGRLRYLDDPLFGPIREVDRGADLASPGVVSS